MSSHPYKSNHFFSYYFGNLLIAASHQHLNTIEMDCIRLHRRLNFHICRVQFGKLPISYDLHLILIPDKCFKARQMDFYTSSLQ